VGLKDGLTHEALARIHPTVGLRRWALRRLLWLGAIGGSCPPSDGHDPKNAACCGLESCVSASVAGPATRGLWEPLNFGPSATTQPRDEKHAMPLAQFAILSRLPASSEHLNAEWLARLSVSCAAHLQFVLSRAEIWAIQANPFDTPHTPEGLLYPAKRKIAVLFLRLRALSAERPGTGKQQPHGALCCSGCCLRFGSQRGGSPILRSSQSSRGRCMARHSRADG
jgi:hypothetical protein